MCTCTSDTPTLFSPVVCVCVCSILPQYPSLVDVYTAKVFCGTYNKDGSVFISAVQGSLLSVANLISTLSVCLPLVVCRQQAVSLRSVW